MRKLTEIIGHERLDAKIKLIHEAIISLSEYESLNMTPNQIRAKLCKLETYDKMEEDGRLVLLLDKNGYCEELGMYINEIRNKLAGK